MNWRDHIIVNPSVCHGAPCFTGTRVMVSIVLDNLAAGQAPEAILAEYPSLPPEAIPSAIAFAADLARERVVDLPRSDTA